MQWAAALTNRQGETGVPLSPAPRRPLPLAFYQGPALWVPQLSKPPPCCAIGPGKNSSQGLTQQLSGTPAQPSPISSPSYAAHLSK